MTGRIVNVVTQAPHGFLVLVVTTKGENQVTELYDPKTYLGDADHLRAQAERSRKNADLFDKMADLAAEVETDVEDEQVDEPSEVQSDE